MLRVVEVRGDVEAGLAERQVRVVEVEQVGVVLVDQVLAAEEPASTKAGLFGGGSSVHLRSLRLCHALASLIVVMPSGMTMLRPV